MVGLARGSAILVLLTAVTAAAQGSNQTQLQRYQAQYGVPVKVTLLDLVSNPAKYEGMSVIVRGLVDGVRGLVDGGPPRGAQADNRPPRQRHYTLKDPFGDTVLALAVPEVAAEFDDDVRGWTGELEVTGVFDRAAAHSADFAPDTHIILFWRYLDPTEAVFKKVPKAESVALEGLVAKAGKLDGKMVRVAGKFRGRNLFGDLPEHSARDSADWVIKDDLYAVWITGKEPRGEGWKLDLATKRDTNRWVEVVGLAETIGNVTYIRALSVVLGVPPRAAPEAAASASAAPPTRPKVPPTIVFSMPLDGERDVPATGVFLVQFSNDMDEESLRGRVLFGYAGPRRPGDRELTGQKVSYDKGRRVLVVDPGDVLGPGRAIELRLLQGILDIDGLALTSRPGHEGDAATVETLRFDVAASQALLPGS